jgi:MOSC domain-containing protein YiiM
MRLESVARSRPRSLILLGREHLTGIAKEPVTGEADIALRPGRTGVTLVDCMDAYYDPALPAVEVDRLLAAPIASRFRTMLQRRRDRS